MSHGVGTTDKVKVTDAANRPVETSGPADAVALSTRDKELIEAIGELTEVLVDIRDILMEALQ